MKKRLPIILLLLIAYWLRIALLTEIPPGLTHDEANHGREALGILDGLFLFYFPLNYGSEPLYSYAVSGFMTAIGTSLFALRYVNVVFGTAVLASSYTWSRQTFNGRVALITTGLLALSFWPLASSRQALRAGMLPFFFGLAVIFFWQLYARSDLSKRRRLFYIAGFGVSIAMTLHLYLAARVAWLLFPLFVVYLFFRERQRFKAMWRPTGLGLLLSGLLSLPLFIYLRRNPFALTRLEMLDRPLAELAVGNVRPIFENVSEALLAFVWPGFGDHFLAYNIPGRPVLDALTAVFFISGLIVCLWHWQRPSYAFVLLWFGVGIVPSLLTGATANSTRNLAALAVVHLIPALGAHHLLNFIKARGLPVPKIVLSTFVWLWLAFVAFQTGSDYFVAWAQSPQVRGAYQHTLVAELAYLETVPEANPVLLSTVYPGAAHDPSISLLLTAQNPRQERWMDARYALLIPAAPGSQALIPHSTAPHAQFANWLTPLETIRLRDTDLDPEFTRYGLDFEKIEPYLNGPTAVNFNNAITLHYAAWLNNDILPNHTAELLTIWQIDDPTQIGPLGPPTFRTDVVMFAHLLGPDGSPIAQRDALEAPSWGWQPNDILIQIQPIVVPETAVAGTYRTIIGFYDRTSGERTAVLNEHSEIEATFTTVEPLRIK